MEVRTLTVCAFAVFAVGIAHGGGNTIYDEDVSGDLSDDIDAPTQLGTLALGVSSVSLNVENSASPDGDFDVFTFSIAEGRAWSGLFVEEYIPGDAVSFLAIDDADTFPVNPNFGDPTAFLAGALFGTADVGDDLFPLLEIPQAGGVGFDGPLGPGDYSVFVQQTGPLTEIALGFQVLPTPPAAALLGFGVLCVSRRRRA
jgi:hypothetical protein